MSCPDPHALAAATAIADRLADPHAIRTADSDGGSGRRRPQSLAGGAAGIALLHIERACAGQGDWTTAHAWLSAAVRDDLSAGPNAGLFFGAPTLAFVTHAAADRPGKLTRALADLDTSTAAVTGRRLDEAHARIDRGERPTLAEFDLIRGLAGLGAHHLQRNPHHDITRAVLSYLVRLTEPLPGRTDGLPGWWTDLAPTGHPSPDYPAGHGNSGMSHGIAGPLALLSLALRRGVVVDGHTDAITRICTWLDACQQEHPCGPWWPGIITVDEVGKEHVQQSSLPRPSWCYGTPGLARAQQLAGLATSDTTRQHTAQTITERGTVDRTRHELLLGRIADWFPLLPRTRPPCRALPLRVDEIRGLACSASPRPDEIRISSAAEALNKAALIASDCGLVDLAQQLCWRQFDIFQAATPLTAKTAKLALQPIVNLGRLATRGGDGARAYRIFENAYDAVRTQAATEIDGRDIDFRQFVDQTEEHQELRKFLWTILLADGTRALAQAGRWGDALRHIEQYKGIGKRMLDGRQVAILARCTTGDHDAALDMLDDSWAPDPWEEAVATCLRTLCLRIGNQPADTSATAMGSAYLRLEPSREHRVFRTRLGLCVIDLGVIDLTADAHRAGTSQVIARVIRETVVGADAYSASDVLSHELCRSSMGQADEDALADIVELSGLRRGTMPANLLDDLMTSAKTSEAQLAQVLARDTHHPSTA